MITPSPAWSVASFFLIDLHTTKSAFRFQIAIPRFLTALCYRTSLILCELESFFDGVMFCFALLPTCGLKSDNFVPG